MPKPIPIYTDHDEQYRADSCGPLAAAAAHRDLVLKAVRRGHYPGIPLPEGTLAGVKMAGFWDARIDQGWGLSWHRNEGIEFCLLETGKLGFSAGEQDYELKAGDMTITRPWQLHHVGTPNNTASRLHWLILDVGVRRPDQAWKWPSWILLSSPDIEELTNMLRLNEQPVWRATPELRRCFQEIGHEIESHGAGSSISRLTLRLNEMFLLILEMLRTRRVALDKSLTTARRTVQLFVEDLRAHPEHLAMEWTAASMAKACGLGLTQFTHHVKCLVNMSPMHYVANCRVELAAQYLKSRPDEGITDIALDCGFSSSQYFATVFSRRFGCAPREFRSGLDRCGHKSRPTNVQNSSVEAI